MELTQDFREFVELLNKYEVRYLIVGGYAVAFHGHPRYTKDLDVWLEPTPENANRLLAALNEFGFGSLGLTVEDFIHPGWVVQLGRPPNRIDLLTSVQALEFAICIRRKESLPVSGVDVPFVNREDLITNKRAVGRFQDLADIQQLSDPKDYG